MGTRSPHAMSVRGANLARVGLMARLTRELELEDNRVGKQHDHITQLQGVVDGLRTRAASTRDAARRRQLANTADREQRRHDQLMAEWLASARALMEKRVRVYSESLKDVSNSHAYLMRRVRGRPGARRDTALMRDVDTLSRRMGTLFKSIVESQNMARTATLTLQKMRASG